MCVPCLSHPIIGILTNTRVDPFRNSSSQPTTITSRSILLVSISSRCHPLLLLHLTVSLLLGCLATLLRLTRSGLEHRLVMLASFSSHLILLPLRTNYSSLAGQQLPHPLVTYSCPSTFTSSSSAALLLHSASRRSPGNYHF